MGRKVEIDLEYSNYIVAPPVQPKQLYGNACSSDEITIKSWLDTWVKNVKANHKHFGSFKDHGLGQLFNAHKGLPCILAGSGPSLAYNGGQLKDRAGIPLISCLHNFHFFEDRDIKVDYYVSLDAGPVVLEEIAEGGAQDEQWYWERTKDCTLIAYIGSDPRLFEKWQGKIYLYNAPVPSQEYKDAVNAIEPFNTIVSNGGNVLGACLYIAKGIFGCLTTAFVGADFCFGYDKRFHGWDSKYDKVMGHCIRAVDVFGNKVLTWQSYANFKQWFDWVALTVPGLYVNCTEGGTFGAYYEGNIMHIKQMALEEFISMCDMSRHLKLQCMEPNAPAEHVLF